jgi:hypothetical protein
MTAARFPDAPAAIAALPLDRRGFPVPWFVPWIDGDPEFRAVDPRTVQKAHDNKLCWICGTRLGSVKAFVIGPMCAVNRVSAEPPSHPMCAQFAVRACPFLSMPLAKRADISGLPHAPAPGLMIDRNPGVTLIWTTQTYRAEKQRPYGLLFFIGSPLKTEWFTQGRPATGVEIIESIRSGLPALVTVAQLGGQDALRDLQACVDRAMKLVPVDP